MKTMYEVIGIDMSKAPAMEILSSLFTSDDKMAVAKFLLDNCITDDMACVEEYMVYDDGGFAVGGDYDTPSHFYATTMNLTGAVL